MHSGLPGALNLTEPPFSILETTQCLSSLKIVTCRRGYASPSVIIYTNTNKKVASVLPLDTNIYGLGEVVSGSGFRRDMGANGGNGTIQTLWARDEPDPIDENMWEINITYLNNC